MMYEKINNLHIELTTSCNASCPMCSRNINGGKTIPNLLKNDFEVAWLDNIDINIQSLTLCGNYGDPCAYNNLHEFLNIWYTKFNKPVIIMTNGGMHNKEYWAEIANIAKRTNGIIKIVFGIDGLEDTNHLYRRNVKWSKLMENAKAFIDAGGDARWKFILFKHNEHQVDEARDLAKEMGFTSFEKIKSNRFKSMNSYDVHDIHGNIIYQLEKTNYKDKFVAKNTNRSSKTNIENTYINCYAKKEESIYIAADGRVYPCCNMGYHFDNGQSIVDIIKLQGELGINNIGTNKMSEIINGDFFNAIESSWNTSPLLKCLITCAQRRDNLCVMTKLT